MADVGLLLPFITCTLLAAVNFSIIFLSLLGLSVHVSGYLILCLLGSVANRIFSLLYYFEERGVMGCHMLQGLSEIERDHMAE